MKRLHFLATTLTTLTVLSLFGCGGGGNSGNSTGATRELLTGNATETSLSIRYWRTVSIKANTTYYNATGADQTCPVTITSKDGEDPLGCSDSVFDAYRADGKILYDVTSSTPNWNAATDTFTINGSEVTITDSSATEPTETRTIIAEVLSSSVSGGVQLLRLRVKKETLVNGTDRPNNVGIEIVLGEAAA